MTALAASRPARWWAVALMAAGALASTPVARASATGVQVGVWSEAQPDGGSLPYPPQVPAGGLWVSSAPTGPTAISAVRFTLDDGDTAPVVTLSVAKITAPPDSPASSSAVPMLACRTTSPWTPTDPASPGPWSTRPTYDCSAGQVGGVLSSDGSTVTFDLTTIAPAGAAVTVAIVPGTVANAVPAAPAPLPVTPGALPAPPAPLPAPPDPTASSAWPAFDAAFAPLTAGSIAVVPGAPAGTPSADAPSTVIADGGATAVLPATFSSIDTAAPAGAIAPAGPPVPQLRLSVPRALRPASALRAVSRWRQLLLGLILTALAAWAWEAMQGSGSLLAGRGPILSLYDAPPVGAIRPVRAIASRTPRTGQPPSLR